MKLKGFLLVVLMLLPFGMISCENDELKHLETNATLEVSSVQTEDAETETNETMPEETRNNSAVVWTPFY